MDRDGRSAVWLGRDVAARPLPPRPRRVALEARRAADLPRAARARAGGRGVALAGAARVAIALPPGLVSWSRCTVPARAAPPPCRSTCGCPSASARPRRGATLRVAAPLRTRAARAGRRRPRRGRARAGRPHLRHDRHAAAGRADFGHLATRTARAAALGPDPDERWLCPMPLSHVGGLMVLLRRAAAAATAVLGAARRPAPTDGATLASLVPTMLARILEPAAAAAAAARDARRRARRPRCWRAPRGRLARRPDLRAHQAGSTVTLAEPGDLETAGRRCPGSASASPPTARSSSTGRPSSAAARCAPATSAGWTTRAA